jgi:hypothetical protein
VASQGAVKLIKARADSLACGPRTGRRAPLGLAAAAARPCRVRVGDGAAGGMTCGPLPSATQGAGEQADGGLGRKASWAVSSAGLLR